jgi:ClpP class serine protease
MVLAAEQIAKALLNTRAGDRVRPALRMSGGTLIALAADRIVMDPNAVLGPVDPQIGGLPASSILKAVAAKKPARASDQTLILADIAPRQVPGGGYSRRSCKNITPDQGAAAALLSEGR